MAGSTGPTVAVVNPTAAGAATKKPDKVSVFWRPQEIVYVIVGPEKQRFGMHKELLCATSPFFKAALEGKFEESVRGEVVLEDTSVEAFGLFNEWLYTSKITEDQCQERGLTVLELHFNDKPSYRQLLDVWILADYLLVHQLQNYIADKMQIKYTNRPVLPIADFVYLYEKTQSGSPMPFARRVEGLERDRSQFASSYHVPVKA
ncbi:hypothetical protein VF21_09737 [Pseudogymnoascus sp. 05NY08]|nr:hypothetical protein VF21_09737 [Pseudogymnoascus sp. 05NY08]